MFFKINKKPIKQNSIDPLSENSDTCFTENQKISEKSKELSTFEEIPLSNNTNDEFKASNPTITNSNIASENVEKKISNEDLSKNDEIPSFDDNSLISFDNRMIHQKNYPAKENEAARNDENDEINEEIPSFNDDLSLNNSDKQIISSDNNNGNNAFNLKAFDLNYNSNMQISNNTNKFTNDQIIVSNQIKTRSKIVEKNLSNEDLSKNDEIPSFDDDSLMSFDNKMNRQINYPVKENEAARNDENDEINEEIPSFNDDLSLNNSDKKIFSSDNNDGNNALNLKAFDLNYYSNNSKIFSINELISNDSILPTIIKRNLSDSNKTIKPTVNLEETSKRNNYLSEDNSLFSFDVGSSQIKGNKSLWENDEKHSHENNEFNKSSKEMQTFNEKGSINISEENLLLSIKNLVKSYSGQSNMPTANNSNKFSTDDFEASNSIKAKSKISSNEDLSKQDEIPSFDDNSLISFDNRMIHQKKYPAKENEAFCGENDDITEIPKFHEDLSFNNSDKKIISINNNKGKNSFAFDLNYNSNMPTSDNTNKYSNDELKASNPSKSENVEKNLSNEELSKQGEILSFDDDSLISFDNRNINVRENKFSIKNDSISLHTKSKSIQKSIEIESSLKNSQLSKNEFLNSKLITKSTDKNSDSKDCVANDSNQTNIKDDSWDFSRQIYSKNYKPKNILKSYNLELIGKQNSNSVSTKSNQEAISKNDMQTSDDITLFSLNDSFEDGRKSNRLDICSPFFPIRTDSPNKISNMDKKSSRSIKNDSNKKTLNTENISFDNNSLTSFGEKSENEQFSRISKISSKNSVNLNNDKSSNSYRSYSRSNKSLKFSKIKIDKPKLKEFENPIFLNDTCTPPLSDNKNEAHLEGYGINKAFKQNFKDFDDPVYTDISEASSHKSNATNNTNKTKLSISSGNRTVSEYGEIYQIKSPELNNPNIKQFNDPVFSELSSPKEDLIHKANLYNPNFKLFNDPVFSNRSPSKVVSPHRLHVSITQGQVNPAISPLNNLNKIKHIEEYENITPTICNPTIIEFDDPVFSNVIQLKEALSKKKNPSHSAMKIKPSTSPGNNTIINTNTSHLERYHINSPKLLNPNIKQFDDPVFSNRSSPKKVSPRLVPSTNQRQVKPTISPVNNLNNTKMFRED
jgi:hypothetical protein